MSDAVFVLQAAAIAALQAHPVLAAQLSGIYDGPPPRAAFPYLVIGDCLVTDWGTKSEAGREVRLALTIWDACGESARLQGLMGHVEDAIAALPAGLDGWQVASNAFLRSLVARDAVGPWAGLVEHRIRLLSQ